MKTYRIFAINPGSTSTKIAMFENETLIFKSTVDHEAAKLAEFEKLSDQLPYRRQTILSAVTENNQTLQGVDAFVGRGGGLMSCEGGTYRVNATMLDHAKNGSVGRHPATLGSQLADEFSRTYGGQAFIVNPPDVDELDDVARITGFADVFRESRLHTLNQKETAIRAAAGLGKQYQTCNFVVAHIGGGVSVSAHRKGRIVDTNDIINGDGPMAPTRAGSLPGKQLVDLCFSGKYTQQQLSERFTKNGGLIHHLGTSDVLEVLRRIDQGDAYAKVVFDSFVYQIGKAIGGCAAALDGEVDAVLLTGGIVRSDRVVDRLKGMCRFIAPIKVFPGELEMEALAGGCLRVLTGREEAKDYTGVPVWSGFHAS